MITGLWQIDHHLFYRFNADGSGCTWDTNDDVNEAEASPFDWEINDQTLMLTHKMKLRGVVPRCYKIDRIDTANFQFHDDFHSYSLEKASK